MRKGDEVRPVIVAELVVRARLHGGVHAPRAIPLLLGDG